MKLYPWTGRLINLVRRMAVLLGVAMLLTPGTSWAEDVSVDCDVDESINTALGALADPTEQNTITVTGTCEETGEVDVDGTPTTVPLPVRINNFENLTIQAPEGDTAAIEHPVVDCDEDLSVVAPGLGPRSVLRINNSNVVLQRLRITGGRGVSVGDANVDFNGVTIEKARGSGVGVGGAKGSNARFGFEQPGGTLSFIQDNCGAGISVGQASSANISGGTTIQRNRSGVSLFNGGQAFVSGGRIDETPLESFIQDNVLTGAFANVGSTIRIFGRTKVRRNGSVDPTDGSFRFRSGVVARFGSTAILAGGQDVPDHAVVESSNTGPGVLIDINSNLFLRNSTITDNSEPGILLLHQSVMESDGGNMASGNGTADLKCDSSSETTGDLTGIVTIQCGDDGDDDDDDD